MAFFVAHRDDNRDQRPGTGAAALGSAQWLQAAFAPKELTSNKQGAKESNKGKDKECVHGKPPTLDRIIRNNHIAKDDTPTNKKKPVRGEAPRTGGKISLHWGWRAMLVRKISFLDGCDFTPLLSEKIRGDPYILQTS
jgi:hypothetical protein